MQSIILYPYAKIKNMHNEVLEKFIQDKGVFYIYEIGLQIYGLFPNIEDRDFIVICDNDYVPEGFVLENGNLCSTVINEFGTYNFKYYTMSKWFKLILQSSILAWECACLSKKFIHKEHVKLLMETNPLQLRKNHEESYPTLLIKGVDNIHSGNIITGQQDFWKVVKNIMFANQIIENHKIVNYKEPAEAYRLIVNGRETNELDIMQTYLQELSAPLERFKQYTDTIYRNSKLKPIVQN